MPAINFREPTSRIAKYTVFYDDFESGGADSSETRNGIHDKKCNSRLTTTRSFSHSLALQIECGGPITMPARVPSASSHVAIAVASPSKPIARDPTDDSDYDENDAFSLYRRPRAQVVTLSSYFGVIMASFVC